MTPNASAVARLQQAAAGALVGLALLWAWFHWPRSPVVALAGAAAILFIHAWILALEFVLLWFVSRGETGSRAGPGRLVIAWARETLVSARVFGIRQPFRWRAVPDSSPEARIQGRRGVVFIHGFMCNRGFWTPWLRRLQALGHPCAAVNLEPVFGSIDEYAAIIESAVDRLQRCTGLAPVLVCHSMGGLAARAWLRAHPGYADRVERIITIGSPHRGTWLARFGHGNNGVQMRVDGGWLPALAQDESIREQIPFTCWYSDSDNIVFPVSNATLPGADNRLVHGAGHVDLAFRPVVMAESLALITRAAPPAGG